MQAVLDACDRLRDRLLFAVLYDTGMRVGEALGLRHEDWSAAERQVVVVPRTNDNGARLDTGRHRANLAPEPWRGSTWRRGHLRTNMAACLRYGQ